MTKKTGKRKVGDEVETQTIRVRASNWDEAAILIRQEVGKGKVISDLHRVPKTREGEVTWQYEALTREAKRKVG